MDTLLVVAILLAFVLMSLAAIVAVIDALRTPQDDWRRVGRSKAVNVVLIMLTGGFGGLYFWLRLRPQLHAPTRATADP